jgi:hypothetical protein
MSAATVAVGVTVAATAASAIAKKQAANKANNARQNALDQIKQLDIPGINTDAQAADTSSYTGKFDLQKKADPLSAQARQVGLEGLISGAKESTADTMSQNFIDQVASDQADPALDALRTKLLSVAQEAVDAGATLSPEYQAELVRSGLEQGGTAGFATDRAGAQGQTLRKVLGIGGEALKSQRLGQASTALAGAQNIATTRANILGNLVTQLQSNKNNQVTRAANAFTAGASQTPQSFGLTGADVAGLNIANANLQNNLTLAKGDVSANRALSQGQYISSLIGAGASAAGGLNTVFAAPGGLYGN